MWKSLALNGHPQGDYTQKSDNSRTDPGIRHDSPFSLYIYVWRLLIHAYTAFLCYVLFFTYYINYIFSFSPFILSSGKPRRSSVAAGCSTVSLTDSEASGRVNQATGLGLFSVEAQEQIYVYGLRYGMRNITNASRNKAFVDVSRIQSTKKLLSDWLVDVCLWLAKMNVFGKVEHAWNLSWCMKSFPSAS